MANTLRQAEDDALVQKARTDAGALAELYEKYYERVFRFCVHRLFHKELAEDVTSTVFLEVARRIGTMRARNERDFRSWLYAIAANQANAYIRKSSRRKRLLARAARALAARPTEPEDSAELDWPRLYAAIARLKPEQQTILTLRFFEDLPHDEIAKILEMPQSTVRVTLHRTLNKLRKHLESSFEAEA